MTIPSDRVHFLRTMLLVLASCLLLAADAGLTAAPPAGTRRDSAGRAGRSSESVPAGAVYFAARDDKESDDGGAGDNPFSRRVKAPSLDGGVDWINTAGPIDLKQLRGKFVILDFWTYCCINCMHILPNLKKLEHAYPNEIVVIGVHSAKFENEQDSRNILEAVDRYEIEHPVVNDAQHKIWDKFEVTSWPTLRVIDPEGYLVAGNSGEIDFETLDKFFKEKIAYYRRKGLLKPGPPPLTGESAAPRPRPRRYDFQARCWPTRRATGCMSPIAITIESSWPRSTARWST